MAGCKKKQGYYLQWSSERQGRPGEDEEGRRGDGGGAGGVPGGRRLPPEFRNK